MLGKQPKYHILFALWFRTMKIRGGVPVGQLDTLTLSAHEAEGPASGLNTSRLGSLPYINSLNTIFGVEMRTLPRTFHLKDNDMVF